MNCGLVGTKWFSGWASGTEKYSISPSKNVKIAMNKEGKHQLFGTRITLPGSLHTAKYSLHTV